MEGQNNVVQSFSDVYDKYFQDDENIQAKIKPILNQIHENRVAVKELHAQYGILFSEMANSYKSRLQELKEHYEELTSDLLTKQNSIQNLYNEVIGN